MLFNKEISHQTLAVLTVYFNEFGGGLVNGWVAPVFETLRNSHEEFSLTNEQCSWIASLSHIGKIIGAFVASFILDIVGRKTMLSVCATVLLIMWLAILFTKSVTIIYIVRLAFGIGYGMNEVTCAIYLGEISSPFVRGIFGTITSTLYNLGLLLEFVLATYLSYEVLALVNSILAFVSFISIFGMVEPVQFLLMKGKLTQAEKNFVWLNGVNNINDVEQEFEKIKQNTKNEVSRKSSYIKALAYPSNYKSLLIVSIISSLAGSIGYYPMISYSSLLLASASTFTANEFTILIGICQFIAASMTPFVSSRFNRRTILLSSYCFISFVHCCSAILFYLEKKGIAIPGFPWLTFITIAAFCSAHDFVYPTFYLIRGELLPLSVKPLGNCISAVGYSSMCFLTTKIYLFILEHYGVYVNFVLFSVISLILAAFIYNFLPETRNKSLIDIQELLEQKRPCTPEYKSTV